MMETQAREAPTVLRVGDDVFSRPEGDTRVFLQRPGGRSGPVVKLVGEPGRSWWSRIEQGASLASLRAEFGAAGPLQGDVESFVFALLREGFVTCADPQARAAAERSVTPSSVFEDPWAYQFSQPALWSPWYVLWEITDKCSQHCTFCYNPERENVQVGLGQAERTVADLVRNQVPFVTLLGGEPLSNVHAEEIIRMLHKHRIYTKVITSGVPITAAKVQRLREAGLDQIALSLDALTPELDDLTRGPKSFHHFARARKLIGREIPCVTASLTVSTATLAQLDDLGEFCKTWDLDDVYLSQLRDVPGIEYPPAIGPLSRAQVAEMNGKVARLNAQGTKVIGVQQCSCGRSSAVIQPDGQLRACPFTPAPSDTLVRGDLARNWSRVAKTATVKGAVTSDAHCYKTFSDR